MGKQTGIEWTDHTFNPWIGCTKVSAGCSNCYAEALMDKRWGKVKWGKGNPRQRTSANNWREPIAWDKAAALAGKRAKVFCASLADVFDQEIDNNWRVDLFDLIHRTPNLDWLLLTKRIQAMKEWIDGSRHAGLWGPPANVWCGVSVEDQATADERLPILLQIDAHVRWVSYEPALGPVDFTNYLDCGVWKRFVNWIIVGGESAQGMPARPFDVRWASNTVRQCHQSGAAVFVKQLGSNPIGRLVGATALNDPKGKDPSEWPAEIRVREFPVVR